MAKTKLTPFARLFLFLLVFIPLGYFGFKYMSGEGIIPEMKNSTKTQSKPAATNQSQCDELLLLKDREIEVLKERIKQMQEGN